MQITITVKLFALLRNGRFQEQAIAVEEGTSIAEMITRLEIPEKDLAVALVNGKRGEPGLILKDGDTLSLFPLIGGG